MNAGLHIQEALPDWAPSKRELLITGIHPSCWDEMFADPDDYEEADNAVKRLQEAAVEYDRPEVLGD